MRRALLTAVGAAVALLYAVAGWGVLTARSDVTPIHLPARNSNQESSP